MTKRQIEIDNLIEDLSMVICKWMVNYDDKDMIIFAVREFARRQALAFGELEPIPRE